MTPTYKAMFDKLRDDPFVRRATRYAYWTLPRLMTYEDGKVLDAMEEVRRDAQEFGALLVNTLSSKLTQALFPSQIPFFKVELTEEMRKAAQQYLGINDAAIDDRLVQAEVKSSARANRETNYSQLTLAVNHLIVAGNVLLRYTPDGLILAYGLDQFVCRRDLRGGLLDTILREYTYYDGLPQEAQRALLQANPGKYGNLGALKDPPRVEVYTRIHRVYTGAGVPVYNVSQQVDTTPIGEVGTYPVNRCPFVSPVWNFKPGEHYGRGLVEDYSGGFAKLSEMAESGLLYDVNMMKVLNLVSGASANGTDVDSMATKETGEWVQGDPNTVKAYEAGDARKSAIIQQKLEAVFANLARAFMYTGNTRDAERVTMYEIRQNAVEADRAFGGVYSALASSMQLPLAHLFLQDEEPTIMAALAANGARIDVQAGIAALNRSNMVANLLGATNEATAISALTQIDQRIDPAKLYDAVYRGNYVTLTDYKKSDEQLAAEAGAAQAQDAAQTQAITGANLAQQGQALAQLQ